MELEDHNNAARKERSDELHNPETIAETSKNIGWNSQAISRGNNQQVHQQLWSLLQKHRTQTVEVEPSRTERIT